MKRFTILAFSLVLALTVGAVHADLPSGALHVITAPKSELTIHPGDYVQLEHTYLLLQSPPRDAYASSSDKSVPLVRTLRVINPKVLGGERATIAGLFKAETPGRSFLSLEIIERNGKRKLMTCTVDVR